MNKEFELNIQKIVFWVILLLIGFVVGYLFHSQSSIDSVVPSPVPTLKPISEYENKILECTYGCPKYYSFDITGTHTSQTAIIIPTALNHGAGKLLIVDKGRILFESPELPQIYIQPDETVEENGFFLTYSDNIYKKTMKTDHYKYIDGNFVIVKSSIKDFTVVN